MLFYPLPSSHHILLFRHTPSFHHIPSFMSHSIISVTFHLLSVLPFFRPILSHPFIFPYWDPTILSSNLTFCSGSVLVSATTPIIPTPLCSDLIVFLPLLFYDPFHSYCSILYTFWQAVVVSLQLENQLVLNPTFPSFHLSFCHPFSIRNPILSFSTFPHSFRPSFPPYPFPKSLPWFWLPSNRNTHLSVKRGHST